MPHFDLPLAELERYHPDVEEPVDFDAFWERTLAEARRHDLALRLRPVDAALARLEVHDVTFAGFGGHPIKAWYVRPARVQARLPVVVSFAGYSAGRGKPWDHTLFPAAGYGVLGVDARGQGWTAPEPGDTGDPVGHGPAQPGFLTRGLEDPDGYYYRRLYTDAARAVDAARALPGADPEKVVVAGTSQGGGTAIAAAALVPDVAGMMADVPFMQHVRHSVELVDTLPYGELAAHLATHRDAVERTWRTISYVDGVTMAARGRAPSSWSVALMDTCCPPSSVYASYNRYPGPKQMHVYGYNQHGDNGGTHQRGRQLEWLSRLLG